MESARVSKLPNNARPPVKAVRAPTTIAAAAIHFTIRFAFMKWLTRREWTRVTPSAIEMLPVEKTEDPWREYCLSHVQIDIDTTLSETEIKKSVKRVFDTSIEPFSIAIDGITYIVRNRLGTIDGVNILLDLATNARNVTYQRQTLLKRVDHKMIPRRGSNLATP